MGSTSQIQPTSTSRYSLYDVAEKVGKRSIAAGQIKNWTQLKRAGWEIGCCLILIGIIAAKIVVRSTPNVNMIAIPLTLGCVGGAAAWGMSIYSCNKLVKARAKMTQEDLEAWVKKENDAFDETARRMHERVETMDAKIKKDKANANKLIEKSN